MNPRGASLLIFSLGVPQLALENNDPSREPVPSRATSDAPHLRPQERVDA
jgi:hypothetical protein